MSRRTTFRTAEEAITRGSPPLLTLLMGLGAATVSRFISPRAR